MNIKCIAVDDEPRALEIIEDHIQQIPFLELLATFRNPIKAMEFIKEEKVDLIYLDINMPFLSGIQFIQTLKNKPLIVFTTAYSEYAVKSYDLDVLYYLLKPIEFESFIKSANKAYDTLKLWTDSKPDKKSDTQQGEDVEFLFVKEGNKLVKINLNEVLFIEGAGNYQSIQLAKNKLLTLNSMDELLSDMNSDLIIRVHKSFAINLSKIESVEHHRIKIANRLIPIGDSYKTIFYSRIKQ